MNRPNALTGGDWYGYEYMLIRSYGIFFNSQSNVMAEQFDRGSLYSYHAIDGSNNGEGDYEIGEWFINAELYSDRLDRPGLYCICTRYKVGNHGPLDRLGSLTNILS